MDTEKVVFIHNETLFNRLKNEASICDGKCVWCYVKQNNPVIYRYDTISVICRNRKLDSMTENIMVFAKD